MVVEARVVGIGLVRVRGDEGHGGDIEGGLEHQGSRSLTGTRGDQSEITALGEVARTRRKL